MLKSNTLEKKQLSFEVGKAIQNKVNKLIRAIESEAGFHIEKTTAPSGETMESRVCCMFNKDESVLAIIDIMKGKTEKLLSSFGHVITLKNYKEIMIELLKLKHEAEESVCVFDHRKTNEELEAEAKKHKAFIEEENRKAEIKANQDALETSRLLKEYPFLEVSEESTKARGNPATRNLKKLLKAKFPSVKFSVRSPYYGSIKVEYKNGPKTKEVEAISALFDYGHYDAYEDYHCCKYTPFTNLFGGAQFVNVYHGISNEIKEKIYSVIPEYNNSQAWEVEQFRDRIYINIHNNTDFRNKTADDVLSIKQSDEIGQEWELIFKEVEKVEPTNKNSAYTIEEHTHTKKNFQMWIVILADRIERDEFNLLRDAAKCLNGWYSRKWGSTPCGFAFKSSETANQFVMKNIGQNEKTFKCSHNVSKAEKLKAIASKMQSEIDSCFADMTQNWTPKRGYQQAAKRIKGDNLERAQKVLLKIAESMENGTIDPKLNAFASKKRVIEALRNKTDQSGGYYTIIDTGDFANDDSISKSMQVLLKDETPEEAKKREEREQARKIEELESTIALSNIPSFFPTPEAVMDKMFDFLDIQKGDLLLEPSAGKGDLALRARNEGALVDCVELNFSLNTLLKLRGFGVINEDFMKASIASSYYHKIAMNPPFEKGQDIEHIIKAYEHLKDGGKLACVMGEGAFFRTDKKATEFKSWLDSVGGYSEKLEEGAFKKSGTMTSTRLVAITKE